MVVAFIRIDACSEERVKEVYHQVCCNKMFDDITFDLRFEEQILREIAANIGR